MATYHEFCGLARDFGGTQVSNEVWRFHLPGHGEGRIQKVWVLRDVLAPDMEFLVMKSPFIMAAAADCAHRS